MRTPKHLAKLANEAVDAMAARLSPLAPLVFVGLADPARMRYIWSRRDRRYYLTLAADHPTTSWFRGTVYFNASGDTMTEATAELETAVALHAATYRERQVTHLRAQLDLSRQKVKQLTYEFQRATQAVDSLEARLIGMGVTDL